MEYHPGYAFMSAPIYTNLIAGLTNQVDVLTNSFTFNGYNALACYLATPLASACILYIMLLGFGVSLGYIKGTLEQLTKTALKIGLVYMFAMSWGYFSQYGVALFETAASELGAVLLQANPMQGSVTGTDLNSALQQVLDQVAQIGRTSLGQVTWRHLTPLWHCLAVWGFGGLVLGLCVLEILTAKIMLCILLCVAPLFIAFALFDQTKSFFERWLGTLAGYALVLVLVSAATAFAMSLVGWSIASADSKIDNSVGWIPLAFTAVISVATIAQVTAIAKAIGSACGTVSYGAVMMSAFVGGAMGTSGWRLQTLSSPFNALNNARKNRGAKKARAKEQTQLGKAIATQTNNSLKKGE